MPSLRTRNAALVLAWLCQRNILKYNPQDLPDLKIRFAEFDFQFRPLLELANQKATKFANTYEMVKRRAHNNDKKNECESNKAE